MMLIGVNMLNVIICGTFTRGKKKPCLHCKYFRLWGCSIGYCSKKNENYIDCSDHCKYFKRDSRIWKANGKCKVDMSTLWN